MHEKESLIEEVARHTAISSGHRLRILNHYREVGPANLERPNTFHGVISNQYDQIDTVQSHGGLRRLIRKALLGRIALD